MKQQNVMNMEKVTLIIRKTYNDDMYGSIDIDIKMCESVEAAKNSILADCNKGFDADCKTLGELANLLLDSDLEEANSKEISATCEFDFTWYDNGKGEEYTIVEVEKNNEYNHVATGGI